MVRNRTEEQAEKHKVYMRTYNKKINGERKEKRDQKRGYPLPAKKKENAHCLLQLPLPLPPHHHPVVHHIQQNVQQNLLILP